MSSDNILFFAFTLGLIILLAVIMAVPHKKARPKSSVKKINSNIKENNNKNSGNDNEKIIKLKPIPPKEEIEQRLSKNNNADQSEVDLGDVRYYEGLEGLISSNHISKMKRKHKRKPKKVKQDIKDGLQKKNDGK